MARLKSRNSSIPNGLKFKIPELKWDAPVWGSFDVIVRAVISVRQAHAAITAQNGWSTDYETVSNEVDAYNAKLCMDHGWLQYLALPPAAQAPPKSTAQSQQEQREIGAAAGEIKKIWSGITTLNSWIDSGEPAVDRELSNKRASICVACPQNKEGNFLDWFKKPAASAIKKQIEKLHDRNLVTDHDGTLNICNICACPMKLKVHAPLQFIKAHMIDSVLADLKAVPHCWIPAELSA